MPSTDDTELVELRGEVLRRSVNIMDAIVQANPGMSRASLLRQIIAEWAAREVHKASLVMRLAGNNGNGPDADRQRDRS